MRDVGEAEIAAGKCTFRKSNAGKIGVGKVAVHKSTVLVFGFGEGCFRIICLPDGFVADDLFHDEDLGDKHTKLPLT